MSVDYEKCECCGGIICDCGDDWNYCDNCGRYLCTDCLVEPWKEDKESGEMSKDCCPYCSGHEIHNDDLLEFLLKKFNLSREEAIKLFKEVNK